MAGILAGRELKLKLGWAGQSEIVSARVISRVVSRGTGGVFTQGPVES